MSRLTSCREREARPTHPGSRLPNYAAVAKSFVSKAEFVYFTELPKQHLVNSSNTLKFLHGVVFAQRKYQKEPHAREQLFASCKRIGVDADVL